MTQQPIDARPQELPVKADLARLRVRYTKGERLAWLGHLDLISTIERCVRRAQLPFSIGNGFARRMRIQFSSALPTGASSECEYFDLRLDERVDAEEALRALELSTPRAMRPTAAAYVPGRLPALEAWLDRSRWELDVPGRVADALLEGIECVRAEGSLTYLRGEKEKRVDVTSTLVGATALEMDGVTKLTVDTRSAATGSLRPQVLLAAALDRAGLPAPDGVRVRRVMQGHEEDGRIVEPLGPFAEEGLAPLS